LRVLVTGASGRVGRAICSRLSPQHQVVGLDRVASPGVQCIGDLCDAALLDRALAGVDAIIHAAALHAPHVGVLPDAEFERINVEGTDRLLQAAQRHGIRRLVFTSTTALYGSASTPPDAAGWVTEQTQPLPRTIYHRSKLAAEALLNAAAAQGGPAVTILRMSRCFAEAAPLMAAYRLHRGIDARDVAEAHALALGEFAGTRRTLVISAATPFQPDDVRGLWSDAPALLQLRAPALAAEFERRGWRLPVSIDRVYVSARAEVELGWRARYGFGEVLAMLDRHDAEVLPPRAEDLLPR